MRLKMMNTMKMEKMEKRVMLLMGSSRRKADKDQERTRCIRSSQLTSSL
jgi:hypothetical protein